MGPGGLTCSGVFDLSGRCVLKLCTPMVCELRSAHRCASERVPRQEGSHRGSEADNQWTRGQSRQVWTFHRRPASRTALTKVQLSSVPVCRLQITRIIRPRECHGMSSCSSDGWANRRSLPEVKRYRGRARAPVLPQRLCRAGRRGPGMYTQLCKQQTHGCSTKAQFLNRVGRNQLWTREPENPTNEMKS